MGLYWGLMTMGSDVFLMGFWRWWDQHLRFVLLDSPNLPPGVTRGVRSNRQLIGIFCLTWKKCFWSLPYYLWCCKLKTEYMWFVMARKNLVFTFLTWVKLDTYDWTYWTWCSIIMDMENGWANKTNAVQSHSGFLGQHMLLDTRCKKWSTWGL